jgi:hypothetical protein
MEGTRTELLRRIDYLWRQLRGKALHRREEFTEVTHPHARVLIPPSAPAVLG